MLHVFCETLKIRCKVAFQTLDKEQLTRVVLKLCWLSFVVSSVSLSLSHWYPGSGVVLDCIDS